MDWFTKALELKEAGKTYREISDELGVNFNTVRSRFRRFYKTGEGEQPVKPTKAKKIEKEPVVTPESELKELLIPLLKKGKSVSELVRATPEDVDANRVITAIEQMEKSGSTIDYINGKFLLRTIVRSERKVVNSPWDGEKVIKFAIVSDMHMNSRFQQLTHLNTFYDLCVKEGITDVYNAGDLTEGEYKSRPGHVYEIFNHGADQQTDYIIENYPRREGITTRFITGNHDHTHLKNAGHDIGRVVGDKRDDMIYLGINNATIMLTPNCRMDLNHPLDGSAYALSYSLQKSIEAMPIDDLPDIFVVGHHHKSIYLNIRGIHALEAGTFQAQSTWMKGKRLAAHVGGWLIELHVDNEGRPTRFKPEWVPFNEMIENDY